MSDLVQAVHTGRAHVVAMAYVKMSVGLSMATEGADKCKRSPDFGVRFKVL